MASPKLSDKYKGKSFGEISKMIESKYADRYDPISNRGKMAEMQSLRDEQEYQKQKLQIQQNLTQAIAQASQPQPQQVAPQQQMQAPIVGADNGGVGVPMPQEDQGAYSHAASQSYNQQFALGGLTNDPWKEASQYTPRPIDMSGFDQQFNVNQNKIDLNRINQLNTVGNKNLGIAGLPQSQVNPNTTVQSNGIQEGINPMRYAPLVANIANLIGSRRSPNTADSLRKMGINTQITDEGSQVVPRQSAFNNIDFSGIERGITNQARAFTAANTNASGGNSGMFIANELGNQGNIMNAITQARLAQQQGNQQVTQLNAQEQARIDSINLNQAQNAQQVQGQNIGLGMQMADLDARNEGAFVNNRNAQIAGLATNLGAVGKEEDQMKMIANALGYSSFGNFMESMTPEEREKALPNLINMLSGVYKSRN